MSEFPLDVWAIDAGESFYWLGDDECLRWYSDITGLDCWAMTRNGDYIAWLMPPGCHKEDMPRFKHGYIVINPEKINAHDRR